MAMGHSVWILARSAQMFYEFERRATAEKAIVIVLNVAAVIYLWVSR